MSEIKDIPQFSLHPIGFIHSPYLQKFAVPRQPGLAPSVVSKITFIPPYCDPEAFKGLQGFSHIHLLFIFDKAPYSEFKATVRPPRLGGNKRVGVFASRSPFRPSRIGLSVVKLEKVGEENGRAYLEVSGADLVDGTPIIDIKPYIPFVDAHPEAKGGFADKPPSVKEVVFLPEVLDLLNVFTLKERQAVTEILAQDPRPAYKGKKEDGKIYKVAFNGYDIAFKAEENKIIVCDVIKLSKENAKSL